MESLNKENSLNITSTLQFNKLPDQLLRENKIRELFESFEILRSELLHQPVISMKKELWNRFFSLNLEIQNQIVRGQELQMSFIQECIQSGIEATDEASLLKKACFKLSMIPNEEVFNHLNSGDIVEVFDGEFKQIYRSFSCFSLCNYSLLELSLFPIFELYERSSHVTGEQMKYCQKMINEKLNFIWLQDEFPPYTIRELRTDEKTMYSMREKFIGLVKDRKGSSYYLTAKNISPIDAETTKEIQFI